MFYPLGSNLVLEVVSLVLVARQDFDIQNSLGWPQW